MSVLAICGSLREDSNTNKLVRKVAEASGAECEIIELSALEIKPCTGCMTCMMSEGQCPLPDDMQVMYEQLMQADGLILGAPTYYLDISGAVKTLIDRSMALNYRGVGPLGHEDMPWLGQRPLYGKPGVAVTTVAGAGHERAIESLRLVMEDCYQLSMVALLAEPVGMGDVDEMSEVLARAAAAGRKLGDILKTR